VEQQHIHGFIKMNYLSDKQRVEMMIPALLMRVCFVDAVDDKAINKDVDKALLDAIAEPLNGLDFSRKKKVLTRVEKIVEAIVNEYDGSAIFKVMLMTYFIVMRLLEQGVMELYEGSPFAEALEAIADGMYKYQEEAKAIEPSARKHADKVLNKLKSQGYYNG